MRNRLLLLALLAAAATVAALPCAATAEPYVASVHLLGGVGGSLDGEPSSGFGNRSLEIGFSMPTDVSTVVGLRVGNLELSDRSSFEGLANAKLEYATVAGEYRFGESYYTSGLFLGLGAYRLSGDVGTERSDETQVGVTLGVNGEFEITRRLSFLIQGAGHYVNFSHRAQMYANAQAGLVFHF